MVDEKHFLTDKIKHMEIGKETVKDYEKQQLNKSVVSGSCQWTRTQYYNAKKYLREHSLVNWLNGDMWNICLQTIREYEAAHISPQRIRA